MDRAQRRAEGTTPGREDTCGCKMRRATQRRESERDPVAMYRFCIFLVYRVTAPPHRAARKNSQARATQSTRPPRPAFVAARTGLRSGLVDPAVCGRASRSSRSPSLPGARPALPPRLHKRDQTTVHRIARRARRSRRRAHLHAPSATLILAPPLARNAAPAAQIISHLTRS